MEEADRQQSWRIRVTAKAKHFNFRFRFAAATHSSTTLQSLSFFRFSLLLNLPHFLFTFTSHPKKPKINQFFQKFQLRNKSKSNIVSKLKTSSKFSDQLQLHDAICICKKYCVRIVTMLIFLASVLLKKFKMVKVMNFAPFRLVGAVTMVYYLLIFFYYNYSYNFWEFMGRSMWNKMSSLK
ncbi:hypothetical protein MtrunA17_Chr7g0241001 [Medicago truncatula]|uniref:Transmembrane protein n=1 Tax=Medicago truncatula TaxID=3880 RepID=A0A396GYZ7_MEDTR|nr:hypothetical protein MtrunA17_Chr7g0241001 [Medicago truncatula]